MCGRFRLFAHYFCLAMHRTDARDCTKFGGRYTLPFVEFGHDRSHKEGRA
jgi:hypothetical protein